MGFIKFFISPDTNRLNFTDYILKCTTTFLLFLIIITISSGLVSALVLIFPFQSVIITTLYQIIILALGICFIVKCTILTIKRLHDFNFSGWWFLLTFVPYLGLLMIVIPGTKGKNRFGLQHSTPSRIKTIAAIFIISIIILGSLYDSYHSWKTFFQFITRNLSALDN